MRRTGVYTWLFQRITGIALFVFILVHFVLTHYMGPEKRMYDQVVQRLGSPLWKTFDILLLSLALYHGLLGVWSVASDHLRGGFWRVALFIALVTAGGVLFALGAVTVLSIH